MKRQIPGERRCSIMVVLDEQSPECDELQQLAAYLTELRLRGYDVVVLDRTSSVEQNCRVLRWVSRYVVAGPRHCNAWGEIDPIRAAADAAACDKVIVADARTRYDEKTIEALCAQLDRHEVVEPETYFEPLPWWGGIDTARLLVRRGLGPVREHAPTFAFRKRALSGFRGIDLGTGDCLCRLTSSADVFPAEGIFVRRLPPRFGEWFREWPHRAKSDLGTPLRAAFFCTLLPLAWFLAVAGGASFLAGFVGAIVCGSLAMAARGRIGAGEYFPIRACLLAPLAVAERSISIYWALLWRMIAASDVRRRIAVPVRNRGERTAAGR